jgi:hypothetical protein
MSKMPSMIPGQDIAHPEDSLAKSARIVMPALRARGQLVERHSNKQRPPLATRQLPVETLYIL